MHSCVWNKLHCYGRVSRSWHLYRPGIVWDLHWNVWHGHVHFDPDPAGDLESCAFVLKKKRVPLGKHIAIALRQTIVVLGKVCRHSNEQTEFPVQIPAQHSPFE